MAAETTIYCFKNCTRPQHSFESHRNGACVGVFVVYIAHLKSVTQIFGTKCRELLYFLGPCEIHYERSVNHNWKNKINCPEYNRRLYRFHERCPVGFECKHKFYKKRLSLRSNKFTKFISFLIKYLQGQFLYITCNFYIPRPLSAGNGSSTLQKISSYR